MKYGRYEIREELGRGGMGVVYKAYDPKIDRTVALKVLRQERMAGSEIAQRFLKEAIAEGRLSHPNIVTVYDVGYDHDTVYIAMEFLDGQPLNEVHMQQHLGLKKIVHIGSQIANALAYAHDKGIVHRDIKPSNIVITKDGTAKITDFGIARIENASETLLTQTGELLGTPNYMSVEQIKGQPVDGRSDLYSLGVILYELSAGRRPFVGENLPALLNTITTENPTPPIDIKQFMAKGLPMSLSEVILKSLKKKPGTRFQNGREMADALSRCIGEAHIHVPSFSFVNIRRRKQIATVIGVVFIFIMTGVAVFYLHNRKNNNHEANGTAFVNVASQPKGARLYVNDSLKGRTPLRVELPLGEYEVRLNLPLHYEWKAQVKLEESDEVPLNIRLVPIDQR